MYLGFYECLREEGQEKVSLLSIHRAWKPGMLIFLD